MGQGGHRAPRGASGGLETPEVRACTCLPRLSSTHTRLEAWPADLLCPLVAARGNCSTVAQTSHPTLQEQTPQTPASPLALVSAGGLVLPQERWQQPSLGDTQLLRDGKPWPGAHRHLTQCLSSASDYLVKTGPGKAWHPPSEEFLQESPCQVCPQWASSPIHSAPLPQCPSPRHTAQCPPPHPARWGSDQAVSLR